MRNDIRFAGMALGWSSEYVSAYAKKLKEMGFCIRPCVGEGANLIAYSYRQFSTSEMEECLLDLLSGEGKADKSS